MSEPASWIIPDDAVCECGHTYRWYGIDYDPDTTSVFYELEQRLGRPHLEMGEDVVEVECPHRNGTIIQQCPICCRTVGVWGVGEVGGMECQCWD